jgi:hypothetical protein
MFLMRHDSATIHRNRWRESVSGFNLPVRASVSNQAAGVRMNGVAATPPLSNTARPAVK